MTYQKFSFQVKQLVNERGWMLSDLADRMGVHPSRISHMLKKEQRLQPETVEKIARALGVPAEHFDLYIALRLPQMAKTNPVFIEMARTLLKGDSLVAKPMKKAG